MKKKLKVAEQARAEHEDRENRRHRLKRLRGHGKSHPKAKSLRDRRTAGKHGDPNV